MQQSITAAPVSQFIDDVEYHFSPLTLEDYETLENWLRGRLIEAARDSLPPSIDRDKYQAEMKIAYEVAMAFDIYEDENFEKLFTISGFSRLLHRMVVKRHPDVKLSTCREWITDKSLLKTLMPKIKLMAVPRTHEHRVTGGVNGSSDHPTKGRRLSKRSSRSASSHRR